MVFAGRLSAEFEFLAACCRWPHEAATLGRIEELASASLDWDEVTGLAGRHRVEGLVHHALTATRADVPDKAREAFAVRARAIAAESLVQTALAIRLDQWLSEARIDFLFVKGATLAMLAYGDLSVKQARDIDLLVAPDQAQKAASILRREGFALFYPSQALDEEGFALWMNHCKESSWTRGDTLVELHSALADNDRLLAGLDAASARQDVPVGSGRTLPTLEPNGLFAYLCVHGAIHGWSRLKWLADLAAFAGRQEEQALEAMYRHAQAIGAGRSAAQALLLSNQLLALPIPSKLLSEILGDRRNRWLASLALRTMAGTGTRELDDQMLGTVGLNLSHFLLGRGISYKFSEAGRKLNVAENRVILPLPRGLSFLYPVLALPMWIIRRYRAGRS